MANQTWLEQLGGVTSGQQNNQAQNNQQTSTQSSGGSWLDQLKQTERDFFGENSTAPLSLPTISEQLASMPNSEKLSGFEKWVYKKLPGFSESTVGKALASFGESIPGKILAKLDIFAEGLERIGGLAAQVRDMRPGDDFDLKTAWEAGSMFYDVAQLPSFKYDENGNLIGMEMDSDMPGAYALTEARKLMQDGKSLEEVRDILYKNLGALALRAQLQDTAGHILLDPLNFILGAAKPIEKLHAIRTLALTGKVDVATLKVMQAEAKALGRVEDFLQFSDAIVNAEKSGKAMTRLDKFAIALSGGTPYLQDVGKMTKGQQWLAKLNPFALTPQARASELLDMVAANVGEYLVRPNWGKDPEVFLEAVSRAAQGGLGNELGHIAATVQGRTVQGVLSNSDAAMKAIGQEWKLYSNERNLIQRIMSVLPDFDERAVWNMARQDAADLFKRVVMAADETGAEALRAEIAAGRITPEIVENIGKMGNDVPLFAEEFYAKALVSIQDVAAKQSILQFGIKEKAIVTKWADALKAWETIPFIRANPANAVRNVINNEMTLIGRGLGGIQIGDVAKFWKGKYIPEHFRRGFSLGAEELESGLIKNADAFVKRNPAKAIVDQLEGKTMSLAQKIKGKAQNADLGVVNKISELSAKMEQQASFRASTLGWMEFHNKYWNPRTGFTSITKSLPSSALDDIERIAPGLASRLDAIAQEAGADAEKFAKLLDTSLDVTAAEIVTDVSKRLGYDLNEVFGADIMTKISSELPDAIKNGKLNSFVDGLRGQMEAYVDEMFDSHLENLPGIVEAQVQAGGQLQYGRIFGKAIDEFWAGNTEHAMRMSKVNAILDNAVEVGDFRKAGEIWDKVFRDSDMHFNRIWKKFDAYQDGLEKGAKAAGIGFPSEIKGSFKGIKEGWKKLFDTRNAEYKKFFDAKLNGKEYKRSLEEIQAQVSDMYKKMVSKEDELYQHIDDAMSASLPKVEGEMYRNFRDQASALRIQDREATTAFFDKVRDLTGKEQQAAWATYWQERTARIEAIRKLEARGSAALQGDSESIGMFLSQSQPSQQVNNIFDLANNFGIASATKQGVRNDRRILNTVNKYLDEGVEKFKSVDDIPMDVASRAFERRAEAMVAEIQKSQKKAFIPDAEKLFPDPMPIETAISELNYGKGYAALDELVDSAGAMSGQKSKLLSELPEELQGKVQAWARGVNDEMSSFRSAGVQYATFRRDSALLNYNRRTNFDNWIGHTAPFAFWTTHSMANWAIYSLDRPAMMTTYFRTRKFFETAGLPDQNVPTRLKGNIRINLPFMPKWMGDQFIDPLRITLPFDAFLQPWEQAQANKFSVEGKTQKTLEQMLEAGAITEADYQKALDQKSGSIWEQAKMEAEKGGENYNSMDFINMTMTPHAPLLWAYNAARGKPQDIQPFTPLSRTAKNFATMMGVEDWSNSNYNIEGKLRKMMGLPAYDKWDDYRVGRMISNIAAEGNHSMDEVRQAMEVAALVEAGKMTSKDAVAENKLYKEATFKANQEYAGGWWGTILGTLGIPIKTYPEGEQMQRELGDKFSEAYDKYNKGDIKALTQFFEDYPEYESRLALFKSPEERIKSFMVDNMWSKWNETPKVIQDEIKEQLGSNFANMFINKETRNYEAIKPEQLQVWLKLIGGRTVGKLSASDEVILELNQLKTTDPETAWRVQTFYDGRKSFDSWYSKQEKYYDLPQGKRAEYLAQNPDLKEYWNFRKNWMNKNPDLVKFLTDDPKQLKRYENAQRQPQVAVPTANEIRSQFSQPALELISDWSAGNDVPPMLRQYVVELARVYNIDQRTLLGILTGQ